MSSVTVNFLSISNLFVLFAKLHVKAFICSKQRVGLEKMMQSIISFKSLTNESDGRK